MESEKQTKKEIKQVEKAGIAFWITITSGLAAIISGILVIAENISILTFNSQSVLSLINSTVNSSTAAEYSFALNSISSLKNGIIVLAPLLLIAGAFMIISSFYLRSKTPENRRFGVFLTFLFSMFTILGLLIYIPLNSFSVLIFVVLPTTSLGMVAYVLMIAYMVLGLLAGAFILLKNKRYLS